VSAIEAARAISRGPEAVRADLERMAADAGRYYLDESEINSLGYHSLSRRRDPRAAVAIFAFNAHAFPRSVNVYDSLGEAELAAGDRGAAIRDYRKVLELDPHNRNAAKMLERLGVTAPPGP
jgi:D-alanyl-D-alanine carboxypeptidase